MIRRGVRSIAYLACRRRLGTTDGALFRLEHTCGSSLSHRVGNFSSASRSIGLEVHLVSGAADPRPPAQLCRAVASESCRADREAVARHIVALSTYLGHGHVTDTYWYLEGHADPDAANR